VVAAALPARVVPVVRAAAAAVGDQAQLGGQARPVEPARLVPVAQAAMEVPQSSVSAVRAGRPVRRVLERLAVRVVQAAWVGAGGPGGAVARVAVVSCLPRAACCKFLTMSVSNVSCFLAATVGTGE